MTATSCCFGIRNAGNSSRDPPTQLLAVTDVKSVAGNSSRDLPTQLLAVIDVKSVAEVYSFILFCYCGFACSFVRFGFGTFVSSPFPPSIFILVFFGFCS